jgi:hypothetical protein
MILRYTLQQFYNTLIHYMVNYLGYDVAINKLKFYTCEGLPDSNGKFAPDIRSCREYLIRLETYLSSLSVCPDKNLRYDSEQYVCSNPERYKELHTAVFGDIEELPLLINSEFRELICWRLKCNI